LCYRSGRQWPEAILMEQTAEHRLLVLLQSLLLTAIGVACGVCGAAIGTRYFESMVFGLKPLDPATFILVPVGFVLLSALATYVPARRATRVDPLVALRQE